MRAPNSPIGTKNESSLHRALKLRYAKRGKTEKILAGYVCDGIGPQGEAIEVQTKNFSSLKRKLPDLAKNVMVRLIYPVIVNKTIELYDVEGALLRRTKSSHKGTAWDIFRELVHAPALVRLKNVTMEIAMVDAVERRRDDGKGSWRRKGVSIEDRILEQYRETIILAKKADWQRYFLPLSGEFTSAELALAARIKPPLARKTLYTLEKAGILKRICKQGRSWLYTIT